MVTELVCDTSAVASGSSTSGVAVRFQSRVSTDVTIDCPSPAAVPADSTTSPSRLRIEVPFTSMVWLPSYSIDVEPEGAPARP